MRPTRCGVWAIRHRPCSGGGGAEPSPRPLAHPFSLALAQHFAASLTIIAAGRSSAVRVQAEALLTLATAQRFPLWVGVGTCWRGWALAMQGHWEAGLTQMRQGMTAFLATGQTLTRPFCLVLLAEAAGYVGEVKGPHLLTEAPGSAGGERAGGSTR